MKKYIYYFIFITIGIFNFEMMNGQDLKKYKWENRILIIQSEKEIATKYQLQIEEFDSSDEEFRERKLILFQVIGQKYTANDFLEKSKNLEWKMIDKTHETFLSDKDTFRIVLIGLDGNIKLDKTDILTKQELFDLIDSMPMRKLELNQKKH
ncbi:MAG: DUF4174 domain-containing protein [Saprospiraceae bacterium]